VHYYGIAALLVTLLPTLARAQAALPNVYPPPEFDKPYEGYLILKRPATEEEVKGHCHPSGALLYRLRQQGMGREGMRRLHRGGRGSGEIWAEA